MLSLRRLLTAAALLLGLLPILLGGAAVMHWLIPRLEQQALSANAALARTLSQQTTLYLNTPLQALQLGAQHLKDNAYFKNNPPRLLQWLLQTNSMLQAVYLVDAKQRVSSVHLRADSQMRAEELIGLDLSRLPSMASALSSDTTRWSEVFLSSISGQPAVAAMVQVGPNRLVGEISLAELSSFVRNAAIRPSTRMSIMDERGQIIADPDPGVADAQINRSNIPLFGQARLNGYAVGRFQINREEFLGSALRVDPQGWVVLVAEPIQAALLEGWQMLSVLAGIGISMLVLSLSGGFLCAQWLARRTEALASIATEAANNQLHVTWPRTRVTEYQQLLDALRTLLDTVKAREQTLTDTNNLLEDRIQDRTHALQEANEELSVTIEHLQLTRDDLARAERQAALGRLVAGVAHELNTPIGNGLLVATSLQEQVQEFNGLLVKGLTRREMLEFQASCYEASELIARHLHKAAELIQDFKQVAIDQSTAQRRAFDLNETLAEMQRMLSPMLRRSACTLHLNIPAGIQMDSYPGPLGQVIANLVQNALIHAYAGEDQGSIDICAQTLAEGLIQIDVADHGKGIDAATLPHIFDPFFTTRMGQGGTGLGLHIAHKFVNEVLGGSIDVVSTPGQGSRFTLRLPITAPAHAAQGI